MYCSSCFQKAEEGSKFCADCRQKNSGAPPLDPGSSASVASVASESTPSVASASIASAPAPIRPSAVVDDVIANPFGDEIADPPNSDPSQEAPNEDPSQGAPTVEPEPGVDAPQAVDQEWLAEIVEIHPTKPRGAKDLVAILLAGLLLLSVVAFIKALRRSPSPTTTTTASTPHLDDVATIPQDQPEQAQDSQSSGAVQAEFVAAERSLQSNDFESAVERLEPLLVELNASGGSDSEVRRAELLLAASYLGVDRASEAYQLSRKLAAGAHEQRDSALRLIELIEQRKQAEALSLLNTAVNELRAGRADAAAENGRQALAMLERFGGTAEQTARVEEFLAVVERGGSGDNMPATTQEPQGSTQEPQAPTRGPSQRRANLSIDPKSPQAPRGRQASPKNNESQASDSSAGEPPLSRHVRTRTAPEEERPAEPSSQQAPAEYQEQAPNPPRQRPPSSSNARNRSGSQDVLPTYNTRTGGSVY